MFDEAIKMAKECDEYREKNHKKVSWKEGLNA
jgi:hypothetical protein